MAQRARRFAAEIHMPGDEGASRLLEFADELEARAAALATVDATKPEI